MNLKGLDLNLLIVLDTLLAEKNTTRAGKRLFLSQSGTSGALTRLREYFGDPLLVRSGRKLMLTSLAQRLVEPVRQMLTQCETIVNCNTAFDPKSSTRKFRLNMGEEVAASLMRDVFQQIKRIAPGISMEIHSYPGRAWFSRDLAEYLEQGDLDLLIAPTPLLSPLHPSEKLYDDRSVCVVWLGNRRVGKSISLEQYLALGHIVTRLGPQEAPIAEEFFLRESGFKRRIEIVVPSFGLPAYYVIGTDFVATMIESLARLYAKYLPIRMLPAPLPTRPIEMKMQWHRYQDHDPGIQWLREVIGNAAEGILKSKSKRRLRTRAQGPLA
jgi:LysR family transcriptional regulator, nod-box dependent transcriptional activator